MSAVDRSQVLAAVATALLTACTSSRQPTSTATPETIAPSPTVSAPSPVPTGNPYERAIDQATSATTLAQSAQTSEDWKLVIQQWQSAIAALKAVPKSNPNYATAQKLLPQFQASLTQAQQQATGKKPIGPKVARTEGTPLIATDAPPPTATGGTRRPVDDVNALIQQQIQFFLKEKRFASSLQELGSPVPPETADYSYSTTAVQPRQALITAIARRDGLVSYTGATVVIKNEKTNQDETKAAICMSAKPSKTPPEMPQIVGKEAKCPPGSNPL